MRQQTLATGDIDRYHKLLHRKQFLAEMDRAAPWSQLCALILIGEVPRWRAGAVVTGDVPTSTIAARNLARIVKHRNELE